MDAEYRVPARYGEAGFLEKRSRFIGRIWPVEEPDEAVALIKQIKERHWDATHNVYAYILRRDGLSRHSDDGEPSGTAGMPVLDVLVKAGVYDACCVVTRYFGGVLLGAGGLVRAYSKSAKLALEAAGITEAGPWSQFFCRCPYKYLEQARARLEAGGGVETGAEYASDVLVSAMIPKPQYDKFAEDIRNITAGAVIPELVGEVFRKKGN